MKFKAGDIISNGYYRQIILQVVNPGIYLSVVLSYGENGQSYRLYRESVSYIDAYYELDRS
jgi:hypothetical protein